MKRLGSTLDVQPRLALSFHAQTMAEQQRKVGVFEQTVSEGRVTSAFGHVLVDDVRRPKRLAVLGYRQGATVLQTHAKVVEIHAFIWREKGPPTKGRKAPSKPALRLAEVQARLEPALRLAFGPERFDCEITTGHSGGVAITLRTQHPDRAMKTLQDVFNSFSDVSVRVELNDTSKLGAAIRRLRTELA
jgi:hypothetical protein